MRMAAFQKIGNIKAVAVEMDDSRKLFEKSEELRQDRFFRVAGVGEPLDQLPRPAYRTP